MYVNLYRLVMLVVVVVVRNWPIWMCAHIGGLFPPGRVCTCVRVYVCVSRIGDCIESSSMYVCVHFIYLGPMGSEMELAAAKVEQHLVVIAHTCE